MGTLIRRNTVLQVPQCISESLRNGTTGQSAFTVNQLGILFLCFYVLCYYIFGIAFQNSFDKMKGAIYKGINKSCNLNIQSKLPPSKKSSMKNSYDFIKIRIFRYFIIIVLSNNLPTTKLRVSGNRKILMIFFYIKISFFLRHLIFFCPNKLST